MKKEFKAESKQLLELMINSIYSNKEIFLREIISNASDAIDKRQFLALQDKTLENDSPEIRLEVDKKKRTITITDNGIGMNESDLEENLGTIAHSGSKEFMKELEEKKDIDVIGQFGVGFYASFIVSDKVEVITKKGGSNAYKWISDGIESYEIEESEKNDIGTQITLFIKKDKEFNDFLETNEIEALVKKYSDFIKYPITIEKEVKIYDKDEDGNDILDKYQTKKEIVTINSMKAIWKKDKASVLQEEYDNFYMSHFHDWQKPLKTIHRKVEGNLNYEMLLFIPSHRGFDFFSPTYKKQIDLYSKSVFIEGDCEYLISDAFKFVKGIIDSEDLSLNISREMLQHDANVNKLAKAIESKIKSELLKMQKNERELYEQFYDEFGQQLVYGVYDNFGAKKEVLKDLIMFKSTKEEKYVTLKEYVERMSEDQKDILYIAGSSIEQINKLPIMEQILADDSEVLYFLNEVDEFAISVLNEYEGKTFKSIASAEYKNDKDEDELKDQTNDNKDLLAALKDSLKSEVSDVVLTNRLKSSAVYLTSKDNISIEMEKTLSNMPDSQGIKANKVLEINPNHELFSALTKVYTEDKDEINDYAKLLYNQALLVEGLKIDNPIEYSELLTKLMIKASK
ncbi:molecular chaperone HtpG [Bacilli bacterium PM5-9]|nr:molecular chaperone HtpG [Bacilli bacterium PM5-9]